MAPMAPMADEKSPKEPKETLEPKEPKDPKEPKEPKEPVLTKADLSDFRAALLTDVKVVVKEIVNHGAAAPLHKMESDNAALLKRFDEAAARLGALEGRLAKVEATPVGTGPVLREVGAASHSSEEAILASLDQLIKEEADPTVRQALMAKRAAAALKSTYRSGGVRIG
jgi:hypothetical protein